MRVIDADELIKRMMKICPYRRMMTLEEQFAVEATKGDIYKLILELEQKGAQNDEAD